MTDLKFSPDQFLPGDTVLGAYNIRGTVTRVEVIDDQYGGDFRVWGYYGYTDEKFLWINDIRGHIPLIKPYDPTQGNEPDDV